MKPFILLITLCALVEGKTYENSYCVFNFCNKASPPACEVVEGLLTDDTIDKAIDWAHQGRGNVHYECNPKGQTGIPEVGFRAERKSDDAARRFTATADDTLRAQALLHRSLHIAPLCDF